MAPRKSLPLVELGITRLLQGASSIEAVAEDILRTLCVDLDWELGELWLLDADSEMLTRAAAWYQAGFDSSTFDVLTRGVAVSKGYGLSGRVIATGEVAWVSDIRRDPAVVRRRAAARAGLRTAVCFPLTSGHEVTGALALFRREAVEPDAGLTAAFNEIGRKVGELARRDQALRRSGAHFRAMVENQADIVALVGMDGTIHYENGAVTQVLGYERRERLGRNVSEFVHPGDMPAVMAAFRTALATPGSLQFLRARMRHKDGSWRVLESTGRIMVDASGRHVALVSSRDIGGRHTPPAQPARVPGSGNPWPLLTERELETLRLVARGMSNKQIAEASGISPYTVKDRLQAAMRKLGTNSRTEAAAIATRRGLI